MPKAKFQPPGCGMTPSKTTLGKFLRARRLELGLRQVQVAEELGWSQSGYSNFEVGLSRFLDINQAEQLAKVLQCDPETLKVLGKNPAKEPETELGKFIRKRREELKLTREQLAKRLKIKVRYVSELELKSRKIRLKSCVNLATALECDAILLRPYVYHSWHQTKLQTAVGQFIRSKRQEQMLSQRQVAKMLGFSPQHVSNIENGKTSLSDSQKLLERLAEILKFDLSELNGLIPNKGRRVRREEKSLGAFLTGRRLELNLSQKALAGKASISVRYYNMIECGRSLTPSFKILRKLAVAVECELSDLEPFAK